MLMLQHLLDVFEACMADGFIDTITNLCTAARWVMAVYR